MKRNYYFKEKKMRLSYLFQKFKKSIWLMPRHESYYEDQMLLLAKLLVENVKNKKEISSLKDVEFKVFSQWGDDGIIQWLIHNLEIPNETFVEFGVNNYIESNTRFLLLNDNWSGLVMDGSKKNIENIKQTRYYRKYDLDAVCAFIDCDNINDLILARKFDKNIGILHIDIDGNDYWVWEKIDVIDPVIVIMEYNSIFGKDRAITIPYDNNFQRRHAHYSDLYFGASLKALNNLAEQKGYAYIGSNTGGNNAFFVKKEKLNDVVRAKSVEEGFVDAKSRESKDSNGVNSFLGGEDRLTLIKGMPIFNVEKNKIERL